VASDLPEELLLRALLMFSTSICNCATRSHKSSRVATVRQNIATFMGSA
jgi:hypothetical protein